MLWVTNERSDSFVEYSTEGDFSPSDSVRIADLVIAHRAQLTGLTPGTKYYYRVNSTDAAGNVSGAKGGSFFTRKLPAARPPVITRGPPAPEVTDTTARIVWRTDEVSTSVVEYASREDLLDPIRLEDADLVDEHDVLLAGLEAETRYFYRVRSVDAAGSQSRWKRGHFRTLPGPDTDPPVILLGPVAISRTHRAATIKFVTNEPVSVVINYGPGTEYGLTESRDSRRTVNLVRLTDLEPNTLYHYQVVATDAAGLSCTTDDHEFITRNAPDTRRPRSVIRPHVIGRFLDRLVVAWETDEPCIGTVEYGLSSGLSHVAYSDSEDRKHTATLTEVDEDTEIHFQVSISDASGNGPVLSDAF